MVMKVENTNPFAFRGLQPVTKPDSISAQQPEMRSSQESASNFALNTTRISNTIPDYNIRTPQNYTKLGVTEFANGLNLHSYKLANGHKISIIPMEGSPAIVKNYVNVGSMNETDDIKGISHFLEHMAFNGTTGENGYTKLNTGDSFKKIDKLGGWINASTDYAVTDYVNSTPLLSENDLEEQIKVMAAMTEDLALTPEMIEKEKGPVCSEINMILDEPDTILVDQTVRTLFNIKSSADELVGGSTKHIQNLTREKVKEYYDKYYTPDNMNLVITGDVDPDKVIELVSKNFRSQKVSKGKKFEEKLNPLKDTVRKDFITDKAKSCSVMLGFAGPKNNDIKSKFIHEILGVHIHSTDLGLDKELRALNTYGSISKDKISNNPYNPTMISYVFNTSEKNSEKALRIVYNKLSELRAPTKENLEKIKEGLLQDYKNAIEHSSTVNRVIGNCILNNSIEYATNYEEELKNITIADIQNYIDNYINLDKAALTLIHPKTTETEIKNNYAKAGQISFKGTRQPINLDKISETTLNNNFKLGFFETNNDNISYSISLKYKPLENINPATLKVFNEILSSGTANLAEDEFNKELEENNINIYAISSTRHLSLYGDSNYDNFEKSFAKAKELLYSPRITEEEVNKAIIRIKDSLNRREDTAYSLYKEVEEKNNPQYISNKTILENVDSVTVEDVKRLHQQILNTAMGTISINNPKNKDMKSIATKAFEELNSVAPYQYDSVNFYKDNTSSKVVTKDKPVSQADIMQTFKFKYDDSVKESIMTNLLNSILSSSSIGLFDILREKEHLAYSVGADSARMGDCGEISCYILTTTDNKQTGEFSYDNVQKSINGFNRQINAFINSEYTDEDLENAKRALKAELLNKEGVDAKINALSDSLNSKEGIERENLIYNEIDNITREDLQKFAQKVFKNPPIYTIVASKDTLEANKDFFETLESA